MLDLSFYWITRLDALNNLFVGFIVFGLAIGVVCSVIGFCLKDGAYGEDDKDYTNGKRLLKVAFVSLVVFIIGLLGSSFVPTTKEYCVIKLVEYLESNEKARELPDKIIDKAYEYFDSELKSDEKNDK